MNDIYFLTTIIGREDAPEYLNLLEKYQTTVVFEMLCNGTAQSKTLDLLGIEKTEKVMLASLVPGRIKDKVLQRLVSDLGINMPGKGIALTVPVESLAGKVTREMLLGGQELQADTGGEKMREEQYSLVVVIAERGSSDIVMEAARKANAAGGTVVHAKGVGAQSPSKFFGISIADEKEMVYIVAKRREKDLIMRSIVENAGMHTKAHAAVFSLPVDDVVGLRSVIENETESL